MQGLADGYFILPYTIADYLARGDPSKVDAGPPRLPGVPRPRSMPA